MKKAILFILVIIQSTAFCQSEVKLLAKLLDSTRKERNDTLRTDLNAQFYQALKSVIQQSGFADDSLKPLRIGRIKSPDGRMIFYNWNIQQNNGQNLYNSIVYFPASGKIIELPVKTSEKKVAPDSVYAPNDWPGGLYYKIIPPKKKTDTFYTLLGWDRFNRQTSRKTIEAVTLIGDSAIVFGKEVFKTKEGRASRVSIEYAATASLTLNYSKQSLKLTGVRKSDSRVNDSIIVVDRLAPLNETLEGERWAYVPVGNIYDGYIYFKSYWTFVEGINARNPSIKREERRREKNPDLNLLPKE